MDRTYLARRLWTLTFAVAVLLVGGMACNDHALNPFGASVRSGAVERTEQGEVRPVDILFVVDNSISMCEEQAGLRDNFNAFIEILADANADFRLAVVNTDMRDTEGGIGQFRTGPGTYQDNITACSLDSVPDTSYCNNLMLFPDGNPWLSAGNYNLSTPMGVTRLQDEFACLGLTGIDGDPVEMGLGSMQEAINRPNQQAFFREGALLSIVFVTDENDCFDGTSGFSLGPVLNEIEGNANAGESSCEFSRNIEDSCTVTAEDPGPSITIDGETKSVRQWCVEGNSDLIGANFGQFADHLNCRENPDSCPRTAQDQQMIRRAAIYQNLLDIVAQKNGYEDPQEAAGDIVVAAIINRDAGVRFNPSQEVQFTEPWCGQAGAQSYRYELFAEMFPDDRSIVFPICENDMNTNFAEALGEIAEVIGKAINSVCLQAPPMQCDPDGLAGDGTCQAGKRCCPQGQTCNGGPWLPGTDFEYYTCSGFTVQVELESTDPDGNPVRTPLVQGEDYTINLESTACISSTGSPVEVGFTSAPPAGSQLVVSYPREVGAVFE